MKELIVSNNILIDAPLAKVWEVLVAPKFIRQWDSLPEDFADYYLEVGAEILYTGSSKRVVTEMEAHERLRLSLYLTKWELPPSSYDIGYTFSLKESDGFTQLSVEIGDFGALEEGEAYFAEFTEFAERALKKIQLIAENKV